MDALSSTAMETRFFIVRHPETAANVTGRYIGRGDAPYSDLGSRQVGLLVAEIARWAPERLYSSPLRRAHEVGTLAAESTGVALRVDERLNELDFGDAEGHTLEEVRAAGLAFDFHSADKPVAPRGESRLAIFERSAQFAEEQEAVGGSVAIVTHGGVFRSLLVHLLGLPLEAIWSFDIRPAQVAEVCRIEGHGRLVTFRRPEGESARVLPEQPTSRSRPVARSAGD